MRTTPDTACRWCRGTGVVLMLNVFVECDCIRDIRPEKRHVSSTDAVVELLRRHPTVE